jgi:hypothetical protein
LFLAGYVIQCLPVRGEDWGVLRPFLRLNQGVCQNLVGSRVIDEDIRREVEDLNTLFGYRVEALSSLVGGEGALVT